MEPNWGVARVEVAATLDHYSKCVEWALLAQRAVQTQDAELLEFAWLRLMADDMEFNRQRPGQKERFNKPPKEDASGRCD